MPQLPTELIVDILTRLRPKPLCRFKCVSKSWNSLISSSQFIKLHLNQTQLSQNPKLILSYDYLSTAEFSDTDTFLRFSPLDHPVKHLHSDPTVQLIETVNGIAFISDRFRKILFLFNPETKTNRLIPPVPTNIPGFYDPIATNYNTFDHLITFGFGYNVDDDDYKILRMVASYVGNIETSREVSLYSLRNDTWKRVEDNCDGCTHPQMNGVYVDGGLYFAVSDENKNFVVKCFNLKDEKFSIFDMFDRGNRFKNFSFELSKLGGCLSVMSNYEFEGRLMVADLWIRKGRCWVKLFSVIEPRKIGCSMFIKPVVYSRDGGRVLLELDGCKLGWYDWKREKFERVGVTGLSPMLTQFDAYTYVTSLVSLKAEKEKKEKVEEKTVPKKSVNKKKIRWFPLFRVQAEAMTNMSKTQG